MCVCVCLKDGDRRLVLVPSKFHRVVFLKKGDLVIVEMEPNMDKIDGKVVGSLVVPLQKQQVKHLHQQKMIPMRFSSQVTGSFVQSCHPLIFCHFAVGCSRRRKETHYR